MSEPVASQSQSTAGENSEKPEASQRPAGSSSWKSYLTPEEMFPKDIYFDNQNEDRVSINILSPSKFSFFELMDTATEKHGIKLAKTRGEVATEKNKKAEEGSKKKKAKKSAKTKGMFSKVVSMLDIFNKKEEEDSGNDSDSEEGHRDYRTFQDGLEEEEDAEKKFAAAKALSRESSTNSQSSSASSKSSSQSREGSDKVSSNKKKHSIDSYEEPQDEDPSNPSSAEKNRSYDFADKYEQSILEIENHMKEEKEEEKLGDCQEDKDSKKPAQSEPTRKTSTASKKSCKPCAKSLFKKIIIHMHGGGFMAMNSTYHETYLRLFANETERPVFSIDYRLAPQAQYPQPLHDCIRGYFWIRQFVEEVIGTSLESVIFIGDSAGGNLVFGVAFWLIENNIPGPDLLIGCYSALRLEIECYTPSFFKSMEEYFLSYAGLWACCRQYLPDEVTGKKDKYISPIHAENEVLSKMPKTRLMICMDDPLVDDQFRMTHKLLKAGVDVKAVAFRHFIHGMLSLNRFESLPVKIYQDEIMKIMKDHFNPKEMEPSTMTSPPGSGEKPKNSGNSKVQEISENPKEMKEESGNTEDQISQQPPGDKVS